MAETPTVKAVPDEKQFIEHPYSDEEFINAWQTTSNIKDTVAALELPDNERIRNRLKLKASLFRKRGIPMVRHSADVAPVDRQAHYDKLAELAKLAASKAGK
jgi:hypothetical protein